MAVIKRLNASYRRCYWKSGSEMLFPILFGHLTFASHRCWTVFIKKGVFLAAEAWRRAHGQAVRHAAIKDGGGEVLQYIRPGMDPYPMIGFKRLQNEEGGPLVYEGPNGERYETLQQAYEQQEDARSELSGNPERRVALTFLQKFVNACGTETEQREVEEQRFVVTTSTLEDWLFRGDHPTLKAMSFQVYAMWVYRIE